jgi:aryl carrier-like protein
MVVVPWPRSFEDVLRGYLPLLELDQPLVPGLDLMSYGLDSLATVSLLLALEDRYSVSIPDDMLTTTSFADPSEIWAVLERLGVDGRTSVH